MKARVSANHPAENKASAAHGLKGKLPGNSDVAQKGTPNIARIVAAARNAIAGGDLQRAFVLLRPIVAVTGTGRLSRNLRGVIAEYIQAKNLAIVRACRNPVAAKWNA